MGRLQFDFHTDRDRLADDQTTRRGQLALYNDPDATLDNLREAVTTLEDVERTARRVFGGAHPTVQQIEVALRDARAALRALETPPPPPPPAPLYDEDELD